MTKMLSALLFAAIAVAQNTGNLTEYFLSQPDLSTLAGAISAVPGLAAALPSDGITILAPVNSAFAGIDAAALADINVVTAILSYHVINGTYQSTDFDTAPAFAKTLFTSAIQAGGRSLTNVTGGQNLGLVRAGDSYQILSGAGRSSQVTEADVQVGGIIIHKIDSVLTLPVNVSTTADLYDLNAAAGALVATNLVETVDTVPDLTLFVPTNEAFSDIASVLAAVNETVLSTVLLYHAVTGAVVFSSDVANTTVTTAAGANLTLTVIDGTVFVNSAKVVIPNIITSNGVIHVIDSVLNPAEVVDPENLDPTATPTAAYSGASSGSVPVSTLAPTAYSATTIASIYTAVPPVPSVPGNASTTVSGTGTSLPIPTEAPSAASATFGKGLYAALTVGMAVAAFLMV